MGIKPYLKTLNVKQAQTMSYKTLFVFGLLVAAVWTAALPEDKVLSEEAVLPSATASAKVDFGDLKLDDDNVEKVEKVVKTENGVSAIASVKVKAPVMKFVFGNLKCDDENADEQAVEEQAAKEENEAPACVTVKKMNAEEMKKFMEEFNKRWEELEKKNEENKNTVKCENSEENQDAETVVEKKSPFKFNFQVCSRASAKAVACSNEEAQPESGKNLVYGANGEVVEVEDPVVADQPKPAVVVAKPVEADAAALAEEVQK